MKPVAENLIIEKNNFSKWLYLGFTVLSVSAFFISLDKDDNNRWICLAGVLLFGVAYWSSVKSKIITYQEGFTVKNPVKSKNVLWKEITSLNYETAYHGHSVGVNLVIKYGDPQKMILLPVKQFRKQPMQRFFEILNEQCPLASKNDHFIKRVTGIMTWKDKLKMY